MVLPYYLPELSSENIVSVVKGCQSHKIVLMLMI